MTTVCSPIERVPGSAMLEVHVTCDDRDLRALQSCLDILDQLDMRTRKTLSLARKISRREAHPRPYARFNARAGSIPSDVSITPCCDGGHAATDVLGPDMARALPSAQANDASAVGLRETRRDVSTEVRNASTGTSHSLRIHRPSAA